VSETLATLIFIAIIAQLLISAGQSLHAAIERQRAALESERRASQLKDEFVSMVSHELRTPLTSIAGFTDTLRESWQRLSPEEIDEFLVIMRREAAHLNNLVEDILVIPRLEAGHLRLDATDLDLRAEAFRTGQLVFQDTDREFAVAIPGGVVVYADQVRLEQVLRNLLENAFKYGGDQVLIEGEAQADHYRVVVSDNGPGVPEADQQRIFEHFEQVTKGDARSDQGVGLGLPIARTLARAMGGDLWYEPRFPIGSQFCFTIQLAQAKASPDATSVGDVESSPAA
jgi:two-component system phosphate regulon sensor histidine kinase PhoR